MVFSQAGTPVLSAKGSYDAAANTYTLSVEQSCPASPGQAEKQSFHIPFAVSLLDSQGRFTANCSLMATKDPS